jgi:hypothetical protein
MDNFGEIGAFAGPLLQLLTPYLPPKAQEWLTKQRRFAAGAGTLGEAQQISSALSAANTRMMMKNGEVMSSRIAELINALPSDGVGGAIRQYGGPLIALAQSNPAVTGQIITMLRQMDTPITPLLNQFLGDVPTSYMPLVQSVYADNNGQFNERMLQARVAEFDQAMASGAFVSREVEVDPKTRKPIIDPKTGKPRPIPMSADVAMGSFGLASQVLGRTANLEDRVEFARLAQTVMNRGLAKTSQAAYVILRAMNPHEALRDPVAFDQKLVALSQRLRALPGSATEKVLGAAEMAVRGGRPLEHVLEKVMREGEAEKVWEQSGRSPEQVAAYKNLGHAAEASRTKGFEEAESTKGLTAWIMQTEQGRSLYQQFLEEPSTETATQMFAAARNSPTWATREAFDPRTVQAELSPAHMEALQLGEQQVFAAQLGGKNSTLSRIMKDPYAYRDLIENPTNMSDASRRAFNTMSYHDKQYISNPALRGVLLESMAARDAADDRAEVVGDPEYSLQPYQKVTPKQLIPKPPTAVKSVKPEPVAVKPIKPLETPEVPGVRTSQT